MLRNTALFCLVGLTVTVSTACAAGTTAPAPSFTLSASNVTMASNGIATVPLTFTSVNGFVGSVAVLCVQPIVAGSVNKGPYCDDGGPVRAYPLTANGTATATMNIVAIEPALIPAARAANLPGLGGGGALALAGATLLGFGLRRRSRRFARLLPGIVGIGVIAMGVSGCGGPPTLTPGNYLFMFNANSVDDNPALTASATATVTVPAGIVTKSNN